MKNLEIKQLNALDTPELLIAAGIKSVIVKYNANTWIKPRKKFDVYQWCIFRKGIIDNIYMKGNCSIKYIG